MMSLNERNSQTAPDVLQLNMEIIAKELNDLIVTGEQEYVISQQFSVTSVKTAARSFVTTPLANNCQLPYYGQQQLCPAQGLPNLKLNQNNYYMLQQTMPFINTQHCAGKSMDFNPAYNPKVNKFLNRSYLNSIQNSISNSDAKPTYEFNYLRSRAENDKLSSPITSLNGQGALRKNFKQKYLYHKMPISSVNDEKFEFDLSTLDFLNVNKENSNVQRLFDLLRDLHLAVAESPPSFDDQSDSQFEETFVSSSNKISSMPSTLNVQNQVKQACRKLTIFTYEMQRILNANKVYDNELHAECEFYLNKLCQYLNQLETYKRISMEHKHGQFLREEINAHAERLSLLLEHTNRQVREVHIRILAADWFIGVKYRGNVQIATRQLNDEDSKKSKIGVLNEILQMCNNTIETTTSIKYNTTTATEVKKPENFINSTKQLIFNKDVVNVKPLFNKNNDLFSIYKPIQTKRLPAAATTGSQHTRHPVFYIG